MGNVSVIQNLATSLDSACKKASKIVEMKQNIILDLSNLNMAAFKQGQK